MKTKYFLGLSLFALGFSSASAFSDIAGHPAEIAIKTLAEKGVVTEKDNFFPNTEINRAEFVKIALSAFYEGEIPTEAESEMNIFPDVEREQWYFPFVAIAKKIGAVRGYQDGNFYPQDSISHAESLKVILALSGHAPSTAEKTRFFDVRPEEWSFPWIVAGEEICLFHGGELLFFPHEKITRGEMAIWVYDLLKKENGEDLCQKKEEEIVSSVEVTEINESLPVTEIDTNQWTFYENDRELYDFALPKLLYWKRDSADRRLDVSENEDFEPVLFSVRVISGVLEKNEESRDAEIFRMMIMGNDKKHFELWGTKEREEEIRILAQSLKFWNMETVRIRNDESVKIPSIIPKNASNVPVLALKITAPEKEGIFLKSLAIKRTGLGNPSDITGIKLFEGWTLLGSPRTLSSADQKAKFTLADPLLIPAGESRTVWAKVDFDTEDFGSEHFFEIEQAEDIQIIGEKSREQKEVMGTFPLGKGGGALKNIPAGEISANIEMIPEIPSALSTETEMAKITFGETGGGENLLLSGFSLSLEGISDLSLTNLFVNFRNEKISAITQIKDGRAIFVFDSPLALNKGKEKTISIMGDIQEPLTNLSMKFQNLVDDLFFQSAALQ